MQTRRIRWKRRLIRYRKAVQGYALYFVMIALFLLMLPLIIFGLFGIHAHFFVIAISLAVFALMALVYLAFTKRDIVDKFGWFMLIILVPFFGPFLFWFVGISQIRPRIYRNKIAIDTEVLQQEQEKYLTDIPISLRKAQTIAPESIFSTGNKATFLTGQAVYDAMLADIKKAKHHIHLEMYIIRFDKTTQPIFEVMIEKAKSGVEVRFLADVFGTLFFRDKKIEELIDAGIEVAFFNQNTREYLDHFHVNHRKNLVVDGLVAYTGGFNLGNEYVDGYPRKKLKWYDLMTRIEGNLVESIQTMFLLDWNFSMEDAHDRVLDMQPYLPQEKQQTIINGQITQFVSDGPDREGTPIKDLLRQLILAAENRIYFTTPYLIPPDDLLNDLKFAALSGVDVRIIIPAVPDKKIVYRSTESHIEELLAAGVKIYKMTDHFIHSKVFIFDDKTTMYGTVNLDMRSFFLNFEENVVHYYDTETNKQAATIFATLIEKSHCLDYQTWRKRGLMRRIAERLVRLLNPLF